MVQTQLIQPGQIQFRLPGLRHRRSIARLLKLTFLSDGDRSYLNLRGNTAGENRVFTFINFGYYIISELPRFFNNRNGGKS